MNKVISTEKSPKYHKLNRRCSNCNKIIDDRSKSGLCVKCCRLGKLNPFYNKKHTIKTRQHMIKKAKERDKSTYYKIVLTEEQRKEHSKRMKKLHKMGVYDNVIQNWIKAGIKNKKDTKIEKIINSVLSSYDMHENIDYQRNIQIDKYNVDFLVYQEFIIECYGDYWHKNPKYYNKTEDIEKRKNDLIRRKFLESKGYEFISFWENEIHTKLEMVKKELEIFFGSYINLFEWESCSL